MSGFTTTPKRAGHPPACAAALWLLLALIVAFLAPRSSAASLQDLFANREVVTNASGQINGDNSAATVETGEPQHGGKPGGHSLWISWVAPSDGVATFRTDGGSTFDTTLSAYYFGSTNDTTLDKLHEAARNDDSPGIEPYSLIQIGALAGHRYEIAVDGFFGGTGTVHLAWNFVSASTPPPIIVSVPNDQSARLGDPVTLTVNMQVSPSVQLRWHFNEVDLEEITTNLVIPSLQATNVGRYSLRVSIGSVRFFTDPVELQINSDGETNTLARDKILDAPASPLIGDDGTGGSFAPSGAIHKLAGTIGVVRGYNGSQVFDTTFATIDPTEPPHCGVSGGASYWLSYQPPANGTITLDTIRSTFDTVLEVYTVNGALTTYADLISLACDNDSVAPHGAARVVVPVVKTRQYYVVVDGVSGAKGTAWLNYTLNTNAPATPPLLTVPAATRVVQPGIPVTLAAAISGELPMRYSWRKNKTPISGSGPSLTFPSAALTDTADYTLTVTNDLGVLNAVFPLHVVPAPVCSMVNTGATLGLSWSTLSNASYTIEEAGNVSGPWIAWTNNFVGTGSRVLIEVTPATNRFFRLRVN
jgi:hypothetical protein